MSDIGKAYVQIIPSAKGIKDSISKELSGEAASAGSKAGSSIASTIKKTLIAAGIGKTLISTLKEGGKLQQSLGGIETLFKGHANKVKEYAAEAYKTVGVSANRYMENVTGFSASLLQSLGGDTAKAADVANMAMIDMADNSNKMGTAMESIQNAYQGFAKQNYMMLDNLKLGYGGTKTEMERLLSDAEKLTGIKYDINNLSDVYEAIHVIQEELDITGTTAKEASTTLTGSFNAMKASFTDVLGAISIGEGLGPALEGLSKTISTFLFENLIPMVVNIIAQLPGAIYTFLKTAIPQFISMGSEMIDNLLGGMKNGMDGGISGVTYKMVKILDKLLSTIKEKAPDFLNKGLEIIERVATGIWNNLPQIITTMTNLLVKLIQTIGNHLPEILQKGIEIIGKLIAGIIKAMPKLIAKAPEIVRALGKAFLNLIGSFIDIGAQLMGGLAKGIVNAVGSVVSAAVNAGKKVVNSVKSFFGIHSPSRVFSEIGQYLDLGLAKGIEENTGPVESAMSELSGIASSSLESEIKHSISDNNRLFRRNRDNEKSIGENKDHGQPLTIYLNIGGQVFKAFVDRVSLEQNKQVELELAY